LFISIASLTLQQISALKLKQAAGVSLQPDQEAKIAREKAVLQSLRALQEQHPDAAAAFTAWRSASEAAASNGGAALGSGGIGLDAAAHRCALQEFKEVRAAVRALRARASAHCLTFTHGRYWRNTSSTRTRSCG
jgi:hypothetical protein